MSTVGTATVVSIGLGVMVLAVVLRLAYEKHRIRQMRLAGTTLGLMPLAKGERFSYVPVSLMRQKGRSVGVCLKGEWKGQPIMVFDLSYSAGTSVGSETVLMTSFQGRAMPEFALIEKNINLYPPAIDLLPALDAPERLRRHWLPFSRDGHWPFDEPLTDWLEECRSQRPLLTSGWSWEGKANVLYQYRRATNARSARLEEWLDDAIDTAREFCDRAGHS